VSAGLAGLRWADAVWANEDHLDTALAFLLIVRLVHTLLSWIVAGDDPSRRSALLRAAPTSSKTGTAEQFVPWKSTRSCSPLHEANRKAA